MILRWHSEIVFHPQITPIITAFGSFRRHHDASLQLNAIYTGFPRFPGFRRPVIRTVFAILQGLSAHIADYAQKKGAARRQGGDDNCDMKFDQRPDTDVQECECWVDARVFEVFDKHYTYDGRSSGTFKSLVMSELDLSSSAVSPGYLQQSQRDHAHDPNLRPRIQLQFPNDG